MTQRMFDDPVIELARRTGRDDYGVAVLGFAGMTDKEAELALAALDETEAGEKARDIAGRLRQMGAL